ncbi:MAG: heavy metal translocating P-type ATPase [Nitriliruptorales bacterium]
MTSESAAKEDAPLAPYWAEELTGGRGRFRARVGGLHCSLCTRTLEKALGQRRGVHKVAVSLTHEQALVEYDPAQVRPAELAATLRDIGYPPRDPRKLRPYEEEEAELFREAVRLIVVMSFALATMGLLVGDQWPWSIICSTLVGGTFFGLTFMLMRNRGLPIALLTVIGMAVLTVVALIVSVTIPEAFVPWILFAFALVVVFGVARHIVVMTLRSLQRRILNQHVMLEAAALAGLVGGILGLVWNSPGYPTGGFFGVSVLVATYHVFSEWLSLLVKTRSSQAIKRLLELQPDVARVVRDGRDQDIPVAELAVGDLVRIRPGERVPVDGEVVGGHSAVDQSLVTGEPIPAEKTEGDEVIGGSVNGAGTLLVRVSAVGEETFLQQVARHIEDARALKPGILHLVDRVLRVYAPTVLAISALALVGWLLATTMLTGQADVERAAFAALSVLVMGYPCAVGIAAPLSIVRGAGEAADQGIIMRTGEAFQAFRLVTRVVFDKTGTLTEGRPTIAEVEAVTDRDELLALAAAAEASSEHPLGQAVVDAALDRGLIIPAVEDFDSVTGRGVIARIHGRRVLVGRPDFVEQAGADMMPLATRIAELGALGHSVVAVSRDRRLLGVLAFADRIRPDAPRAVAALRHSGITPILVTGDNRGAAERVAAELGIEEVHAGLLPDEKADVIRQLQLHGRVAMVGDGINDAPSLMQADVGVAMGAGTDIALESSDIVILGNRLESVLEAKDISHRSYRKTKQNVFLAFLFNGIGIPLAATGLIYPVWAMIAMALSVTTIFINSVGDRPRMLFEALMSVGRARPTSAQEPVATAAVAR